MPQVDLPVQNLDFLPLLVGGADGLGLHGQGRLRGRVVYAFGELLIGTDLHVDAPELGMQLGPYGFAGNGQVQMLQDPADQTQADLKVRFNEVQAHLPPTGPAAAPGKAPGQDPPLFVGHGLEAWLHVRTPSSGIDSSTDPRVRPKRDLTPKPKTATGLPAGQEMRLTLTIPEMTVPDLAVHNRLLPAKWQLALLGGTGVLGGRVELAPDAMTIALDLGSDKADLRWRDYRATTDLLLQLRAAIKGGVGHDQVGLDLTGTTLRVDDTQVAAAASAATAAPRSRRRRAAGLAGAADGRSGRPARAGKGHRDRPIADPGGGEGAGGPGLRRPAVPSRRSGRGDADGLATGLDRRVC